MRKLLKLPIPVVIAMAIVLLGGGGYLIYALTKSTEAAGPVGYWKLDEGSGYTAYDASGNNNNGTLTNFDFDDDSNWTTGKVAGAIEFDGTDDYVELGTGANLKSTTGSIEMWIKMASLGVQRDFFCLKDSGNNNALVLRMLSTNKPGIFVKVAGAFPVDAYSATAIDSGWHHLVYTQDGTGVDIYIDGTQVSLTGANDTDWSDHITLSNSYIGKSYTAFMNASIDEVKIWNRALSAEEVAWEYNRGGPVGWWKFDEGTGSSTIAYDSSGNGNNGTIYGATSTTGKINSALQFDGTNDYVDCGDNVSLDLTAAITVEAWIKPNAINQQAVVISRDDSINRNWWIFLENTEEIYFTTTNGGTPSNTISTTLYEVGKWIHIAATYDGTNRKIYINGVLEDTDAVGVIDNDDVSLTIGAREDGMDRFFNGLIDDVRIYNYARTAGEIRTDYNFGQAVRFGAGSYDLSRGLVGHWSMDEGSGYTAYDSSNIGNNGTLYNFNFNKTSGWTTGNEAANTGGALEFDGSNDKVDLSGAGSNFDLQVFTVSSWVKLNAVGTYQYIMRVGNSSNQYGWVFGLKNNDRLRIASVASNGSVAWEATSTATFSIGDWHFVTAVLSGNNETARLYIDGQEDGTTTQSTISYNSSAPIIGISPLGTNAFNGSIDEVRIYNRALSADEIRYAYNRRGPVGWWSFDDGSGQEAKDRSGNDNHGTLEASMTDSDWVEGKINGALDFDGTDDYVDIATPTSLAITDNMTVEAWVYPTQLAYQKVVARHSDSSSDYGQFAMYLYSTGAINFRWVVDSGAGGLQVECITGTDGYAINNWYHLVMTFSGGAIKAYKNGVEIKSCSSGVTTLHIGALPVYVGRDSSGYRFKGLIDDVRIYNYARTAAEVRMDYNAGFAVKFGGSYDLSRGLVGYWKFEEGSGYAAYDSSNNSNNGTLYNFNFNKTSGWTTGNTAAGTGQALRFDGTDDYIDTGLTINTTNNGTVTGWAYVTAKTYDQQILGTGWQAGDVVIGLEQNNRYQWCWGNVGKYSVTASAVPLNQWYHWAIVANNGTAYYYVNGAVVDTLTYTSGGTSRTMFIGARRHQDSPYNATQMWHGGIDDVRVYGRALSVDEIRYLYNRKQPIGHWKFDSGNSSGTLAYDSSINGNHGTIYGASSTEGKINRALSFDGTDDYVQATVSQASTTVSMWVQNSGVWEHVVNSNGTYYINGIAGGSPTTYPIYFSGTTVQIGKSDSTTFVECLIDDVRIYNYARTAAEIRTDYNAGLSTYFK